MSINVYDHIATVQHGPVRYRFDALEESLDPCESLGYDEEIIERIRRRELEWFAVRCQAIVADVVLATSFLGGNCYRYFSDFMDDAYADDLLEETRLKVDNKLLGLSEAFQELRAKG